MIRRRVRAGRRNCFGTRMSGRRSRLHCCLSGAAPVNINTLTPEEDEEATIAAIWRDELQGQTLRELTQLAEDEDVDAETVDEAILRLDGARERIIDVLVEGRTQHGAPVVELRRKLLALRLRELEQRAVAVGVERGEIDRAMDNGRNPRARLVALLIVRRSDEADKLRNQSVSDLHRQAQARCGLAGLSQTSVDQAIDGNSPKESLISLLVTTPNWSLGGAIATAATNAINTVMTAVSPPSRQQVTPYHGHPVDFLNFTGSAWCNFVIARQHLPAAPPISTQNCPGRW